jgi:hypothetical protein
MGFIYVAAVLASFCVFALPGLALAVMLGRRAERTATFWLVAAAAAAIAVVVRILWVFQPYQAAGKLPLWSGRFALILSASLLLTALLSASGLFVLRLRGSPLRHVLLGLAAGLAASLPLQVVLSLTLFSEMATLAGLQVVH